MPWQRYRVPATKILGHIFLLLTHFLNDNTRFSKQLKKQAFTPHSYTGFINKMKQFCMDEVWPSKWEIKGESERFCFLFHIFFLSMFLSISELFGTGIERSLKNKEKVRKSCCVTGNQPLKRIYVLFPKQIASVCTRSMLSKLNSELIAQNYIPPGRSN